MDRWVEAGSEKWCCGGPDDDNDGDDGDEKV